jgi:hypothetical protein
MKVAHFVESDAVPSGEEEMGHWKWLRACAKKFFI